MDGLVLWHRVKLLAHDPTRPNPVTWFNSDVRCTWQSLQTKLIRDFMVASFTWTGHIPQKNEH